MGSNLNHAESTVTKPGWNKYKLSIWLGLGLALWKKAKELIIKAITEE